ncbi:MAG: ImmA/IrrE family metallo-endopeptidase [Chitinispirillales bacterium]|jgi:hypothetical protein|nr:ImmA/IrrE family metallo-endopeptidase [Chitinispirillales bacterium]
MPVLLESNVPRIRKEDYEKEAIGFLKLYYPEALEKIIQIPIMEIARKRMGLRVVKRRLSEDFSILGQMCFTNGLEELYYKETDEYRMAKVRYGTMIIDPDTIEKRNEGCLNNTIAHECFHWHKHRDYYIATSVVDGKKTIKAISLADENSLTDEDWMEIQARAIAPRILMPPEQFDEKVKKCIEEFCKISTRNSSWVLHNYVVNQLACFFGVSKQSTEIRLSERGYHLRE